MKESAKYCKRGEIVTFLTIGIVVVLGLAALISPIMLRNKKQITSSKAGEDITYQCRTSSFVWKCDKDGKTADQNAKNAFCGGFASLITDGGNNYDKVIAEWRRQKEINDKYVSGACGRTSSATQTAPVAGSGGITTGAGSVNNGCFKFSVDFEPRADDNRVKFYATTKFESAKKGDVQLNGQGVGSNGNHLAGWNRWDSFPGPFVYGPEWTQTWSIGSYEAVSSPNKGSRASVQYTGMHANCDPQSITVNCTVEATTDGKGIVSGQGCNCVGGNCSGSTTTASSITRTPTAPGARITMTPTSTPPRVRTFTSMTECANFGCDVLDCEEIEDRFQCVEKTPTSQPTKAVGIKTTPPPTVQPRVPGTPTNTPTPLPTIILTPPMNFPRKDQCTESWDNIKVGDCTYEIPATSQGNVVDCGNDVVAYESNNCKVFRNCAASYNKDDYCRYTCFNGNTQVNCKGVGDVHKGSFVTIINNTQRTINLKSIRLIKHSLFGLLNDDKIYPTKMTLTKENKTYIHDFSYEPMACKTFIQSVEATIIYSFESSPDLLTKLKGWGNCTGGVNILLEIQ